MSDAKPEEAEAEAPKKKGKLLIIIIAVVLLLGGGGGAAWFFMKPADAEKKENAEHAEADDQAKDEEDEQPLRPRKKKKGEPPIFVDMEPFVFNLQDNDQDRFAQVGVTLEVVDAEVVAEMKLVEPSVRNAVLLLMGSKTSRQVRTVAGKIKLGEQIVDAANAIMAGEEPPRIVPMPAKKKKSSRKKKDDQHDDGHKEADDHAGDSEEERRQESRRKRRVKYIPERVLQAHFKQFIVQ